MRSVTREFTITSGLYHSVEPVILRPGNIEVDNYSLVNTETDNYCLVSWPRHRKSCSQNTDNFLVITEVLCLRCRVSCHPVGEIMRRTIERVVVGVCVCRAVLGRLLRKCNKFLVT